MNRVEKEQFAQSLKASFTKAKLVVFADYKGLSSSKADILRKNLRSYKSEVRVIKNNLARWVFKDGSLGQEAKDLADSIVGPTIVAFAYDDEDVVPVAQEMDKFSKSNELFKIKDSLIGQKRVQPSEVQQLANLPSKEILLGKLLGSIQASSTNLVGVLSGVQRSLVQVLAAIEKKKSENAG
jgi:large subunit ribosomal protein L10